METTQITHPDYIVYAGKKLKTIVTVIIVTILEEGIVGAMIMMMSTPDTIKTFYTAGVVLWIISSLIILRLLYIAGDYLEDSVKK